MVWPFTVQPPPEPVPLAPGALPGRFPPPPPPCNLFGQGCAPATVSDSQIFFSLWVWTCAGLAFLLLFGAIRKWIPTYHTRLNIPNVWLDPPPLTYGTFSRYWSWLGPVFRTTDAELVQTAGLDALVLTWQCTVGIQIFLPLTVLGMLLLLPTNLVGGNVGKITESVKWSSVSTFSKLTLSNLQRDSNLFWIPFIFVFVTIFYVFWLMLKYYRAYTVLRQHYLMGGEKLINEWHAHFMERQLSDGETRKKNTALFMLRHMFDVNTQMNELEQDLQLVRSGPYEGILAATSRELYRLRSQSPALGPRGDTGKPWQGPQSLRSKSAPSVRGEPKHGLPGDRPRASLGTAEAYQGKWKKSVQNLQKQDVQAAAKAAADVVRRDVEDRQTGWSKVRAAAEDIRELGRREAQLHESEPVPKLDRDQALSMASQLYKLKGLPPVSLYETRPPRMGMQGGRRF
eukprot:jgi/Botrbrau1/11348/Bobra.0038s0105.1